MPSVVQGNAHRLEVIKDGATQKIAPQGAGQADARAGAGFVVNIVWAVEFKIVAVKVHAQRQLAVQEPRLDKSHRVLTVLAAQLDAHGKLLAGAGKIGGIKQIEIDLRN